MAVFGKSTLTDKSPFSEPPEFTRKFIPKRQESRKMVPFSIKCSTEIAIFCTPRIAQEIHPQMEGRKAGKWFRLQLTLVQKSPFFELREFTRKFILESKIALLCGACSKFRRCFAQNRVPVRNIPETLMKIALLCGASLKFRRLFIKMALPCGAFSKFGRYKAHHG